MNPVVGQLGPVLWRVGDIVAGILLIGCPAAIFTLLGFARMTNIAEARAVEFRLHRDGRPELGGRAGHELHPGQG